LPLSKGEVRELESFSPTYLHDGKGDVAKWFAFDTFSVKTHRNPVRKYSLDP